MTVILTEGPETPAHETRTGDDARDTITEAGLEALAHSPVLPDTGEDTPEDMGADCGAAEGQGEASCFRPAEDYFTPDTRGKADWVLMKIADARARAARIREHGEAMARAAEREAEALEWKFGPALQAFLRAQTDGGRRKSVRLYNGVIGYRTKPGAVSITDEADALVWAQLNAPEAVTARLDRKALGEALKASGEVVPFAAFTPAEEVFYIK